jgi:hypothetical protein
MRTHPDYAMLRARAPFTWSAAGTYLSLLKLTGIPIREFNLDAAAGIELYRRGRPLHRELFGPDVQVPGIATPPVSYGHVNGLGCPLAFPEGGEVGQRPIHASLAAGLAALEQPVDYATAGMAPFYLEYRRRLQQAFPNEKVGFGFGLEGPLTTAYELRGEDFFCDALDDPRLAADYLRRVTDSILDFNRFRCRVDNEPEVSPDSGGLADDLASMIPARLYPELVLPFWEQYFSGITSGRRNAHVEDLRAEQLPHLETAGISRFDPSISHKLNPRLIRDNCRVPFLWRLGGFHYPALDVQGVTDFVFQSAADGASGVITYMEGGLCDPVGVSKVKAFVAAAREVARMLEGGATREAVGRCVSAAGRRMFWDQWPACVQGA